MNTSTARRPTAAVTPTLRVLVPRKGRGKPFEAEIVGAPQMVQAGEHIVAAAIDTAALAGSPLGNLVALCAAHNIDPSQALAEGFNALSVRSARRADPTFGERLINEGLAEDAKKARIMSILIRKTAKNLGVEADAVLATFHALRAHAEEAAEPAADAAVEVPQARGARLVRRAGQ